MLSLGREGSVEIESLLTNSKVLGGSISWINEKSELFCNFKKNNIWNTNINWNKDYDDIFKENMYLANFHEKTWLVN